MIWYQAWTKVKPSDLSRRYVFATSLYAPNLDTSLFKVKYEN